jgi:hypothetical protein
MIPSPYPDQCMMMCTVLQKAKWAGNAIGAAMEHIVVDRGDLNGAIPHELLDVASLFLEDSGNHGTHSAPRREPPVHRATTTRSLCWAPQATASRSLQQPGNHAHRSRLLRHATHGPSSQLSLRPPFRHSRRPHPGSPAAEGVIHPAGGRGLAPCSSPQPQPPEPHGRSPGLWQRAVRHHGRCRPGCPTPAR